MAYIIYLKLKLNCLIEFCHEKSDAIICVHLEKINKLKYESCIFFSMSNIKRVMYNDFDFKESVLYS